MSDERRKAALDQGQTAESARRSEESIGKQNRILLAILRSMSAGVVVAHETGKFLLFNPEAERLFGIGATDTPPGEWAQRYGCYLPDRITRFPPEQLPLVRALRGEDVEETELFVRNAQKPDGAWLRVKSGPLRDENGAVRGGLSVIRDVTAHKEAERRLAAQYAVTRVLAESTSLR